MHQHKLVKIIGSNYKKMTIHKSKNTFNKLKGLIPLRTNILSMISFFSIFGFLLVNSTSIASAACTPTGTTYGTDTMTVSAPTASTYNVWVRMQAPATTSNSIMLQVDGGTCYNVGGLATMPLNTWTWVNYQNGSTSSTMQSALTAGSHSLELIGTKQGVQIDNVLLLTDAGCIPTGLGTNCTTNQPAPTAPTNVTAKANSPTSVSLNWTGSTDTGGPGLAGYYVLRGGTKVGQVNSSTTTYTDNTAVGATSYSYTIEAFDSSSTPSVSPPSSAANVTTPALQPSSPTSVTAKAVSATSVSVSWTASTDTNGPGLAGYYVLRGGTKVGQVNSSTTTYTDNTATANTTYSYTIEAFDSASPANVSAPSSAASVTTPKIPPPTVPINVTAKANSPTSVSLNWSASTDAGGPGLAGYNVIRNGITIAQVGVSPNAPTYTDNTVTANTSYSYTVQAYDKASPANVSAQSSAASVTTPVTPPPTAPATVTATAISYNSVSLSWAASTQSSGGLPVAGYYIIRNGVTLGQVASSVGTSYADTTALPVTTYTYSVEAYDTANPPNVSAATNSNTVTTPNQPDTQPPTIPSNVAAVAVSSSQINLSWSASTDNIGVKGYIIYRNGTKLATATTTSYGDTGLSPNTSYSYYIVATDGTNTSKNSTTVSATTKSSATLTTVEGIVTNIKTNQPIAGVYVHTGIHGTATGMAISYTNAAGQYVLTNIKPIVGHSYSYSHIGYKSRGFTLKEPAGITIVNVALTPK
jgi:chitodextrinase